MVYLTHAGLPQFQMHVHLATGEACSYTYTEFENVNNSLGRLCVSVIIYYSQVY